MGREIRKVPMEWNHPKKDNEDFQPLYDESYLGAMTEWIKNHELWLKGEHPDQSKFDNMEQYKYYAEWNGGPPDVEYYRPDWTYKQLSDMGIAVYETVSEGTPVSPTFKTEDELIDYLVEKGDYWDQKRNTGGHSRESATAFVKSGWVPSGIMGPEGFKSGIDCAVSLTKE